MELSLSELKKRDVVNIVDGKCLGRLTDINFRFPEGVIEGIVVPGRKSNFLGGLFNKQRLYISEKNIIKIGGDVILVDLRCGEQCSDSISLATPPKRPKPPSPPCPPPCPPKGGINIGGKERETPIDFDEY